MKLLVLCFLAIFAGVGYAQGESSTQKIAYQTERQRADLCRGVCNDYKDICLPTYLDPWDFFSPHCEDNTGVPQPDKPCVLCLNTHPFTQMPQSTTPKTFDPSPAYNDNPNPFTPNPSNPSIHDFVNSQSPPIIAKGIDPCYSLCNNFTGICIPFYLDLKQNHFKPHCEDKDNTGVKPSYNCLECVYEHGPPYHPNSEVATDVTTPDVCEPQCKCVRTIRLSIKVRAQECPKPGETVPPCDTTDLNAVSSESDVSVCECDDPC